MGTPYSPITGASPSDFLVFYPGHSLKESYPSEEMQSVYSAVPANWANTKVDMPIKKETKPTKKNTPPKNQTKIPPHERQ